MLSLPDILRIKVTLALITISHLWMPTLPPTVRCRFCPVEDHPQVHHHHQTCFLEGRHLERLQAFSMVRQVLYLPVFPPFLQVHQLLGLMVSHKAEDHQQEMA
jgi:hypothetical protein